MKHKQSEKRHYPRAKENLKIKISPDKSGDTIDLCEGGLSFSSSETITGPMVSLQVFIKGKKTQLQLDAKLLWEKKDAEGRSFYGVEFLNLAEQQKEILRKEVIMSQIKELLNEVEDAGVYALISEFFLNDMLRYINEITEIIRRLAGKKEYSVEAENELDKLNTDILLKGYRLEGLIPDKKIMQKIKDNFRKLTGALIYKSVIVKRAYEKPLGYSGDYKMLEIVYENKPISDGVGVYFDNNFLKSPYAVAVRIRKDMMRDMLLDMINRSDKEIFRVLNIACGSCREIRELLPGVKTKSKVVFNCFDWDEEALRYSQEVLSQAVHKNFSLNYIKEDVMNLIKNPSVLRAIGTQELIYSIGLIDYLPDRVLKKLIFVLFNLLGKNGKLILTHKNREKTFPPLPPDWFCDWKFVPRNKDEVVRLLHSCGISGFQLHSDTFDFGYIYFFSIFKK